MLPVSVDQLKGCSPGKWSNKTDLTSDDQCFDCFAGRYSTAGEGQSNINVCRRIVFGRSIYNNRI